MATADLTTAFNPQPDEQEQKDFLAAAKLGKNEVIAELLKKYGKAIVDYQDDEWQSTALIWAAIKRKKDTVGLLLGYSAGVNIQDVFGHTALMAGGLKNPIPYKALLKLPWPGGEGS